LKYSSLDENNDVKASVIVTMSFQGVPFELETKESYTLIERVSKELKGRIEEKKPKREIVLSGRTAKYISTLSSLITPEGYIEETELDKHFPGRDERRGVKQSLIYLERKGVVKIEEGGEGKRYRILDRSVFECVSPKEEIKQIEIENLDFIGKKEKNYIPRLFKLEKDGKILKKDIRDEFVTKGERIIIGRVNKKLVKHGIFKERFNSYEIVKNVKID
jgi:hypothetical protein